MRSGEGKRPSGSRVGVVGAGYVGLTTAACLASLGHRVVASTGRPQESDYLRQLGASAIIDRHELNQPGRALLKERWAAAGPARREAVAP